MRWAIVADDLTGAADSAVAFADRGVETVVWLCEPESFPEGACCSVDADARWRDEREAAKVIGRCVRNLGSADWLMLKIDSTLRGFVGAMVQAAWRNSGRKWALIAPAVPKQGRKVINGKLFVRGQPVTEIDLAKERPSPVTTPLVAERLKSTGLDKFRLQDLTIDFVRSSDRLAQAVERAAAEGVGLVCDAETDEDLERIASAAIKSSAKPLFVGASGLASVLAKLTGKKFVKHKPKPHFRPSHILIVVGSQQVATQKQLKFLSAKGVAVVEVSGWDFPDLPDEEVLAVSLNPTSLFAAASQTVKRPSTDPRSPIPNPEFKKWLSSKPFDALAIVGGLTARKVFEALGIKRWDLLGSLLPGMPLGIVQTGNRTLLVATKAGGFGTKQTLWRAAVTLKQGI